MRRSALHPLDLFEGQGQARPGPRGGTTAYPAPQRIRAPARAYRASETQQSGLREMHLPRASSRLSPVSAQVRWLLIGQLTSNL